MLAVNDALPDSPTNHLVSRVKNAMTRFGYKQIDVMRDSGVSNTVLCHWLQRKYKGDNRKVNERLLQWVESVEEQQDWKSAPASRTRSGTGGPVFMESDALAAARGLEAEKLAPIIIDETVDGQRIQDFVLWNVHEKRMTPEWFSFSLCEDLQLPTEFQPLIAASIKTQLEEYSQEINLTEEQIKTDQELGLLKIEIDVIHNGLRLRDSFAWDPHNTLTEPEEFARAMCADLGLGGDWALHIAKQIRLQTHNHMKLIQKSTFDQSPRAPLPAAASVFRQASDLSSWEPKLELAETEGSDELKWSELSEILPSTGGDLHNHVSRSHWRNDSANSSISNRATSPSSSDRATSHSSSRENKEGDHRGDSSDTRSNNSSGSESPEARSMISGSGNGSDGSNESPPLESPDTFDGDLEMTDAISSTGPGMNGDMVDDSDWSDEDGDVDSVPTGVPIDEPCAMREPESPVPLGIAIGCPVDDND